MFSSSISDSGETKLFHALESAIASGLPQETVEWKRSYGRPPRAVTLGAEFQPFKVDTVNAKENVKPLRTITGCQVLHTYWVECPVSIIL